MNEDIVQEKSNDIEEKKKELEEKYKELMKKVQELDQTKQALIAELLRVEGAIKVLEEIK